MREHTEHFNEDHQLKIFGSPFQNELDIVRFVLIGLFLEMEVGVVCTILA